LLYDYHMKNQQISRTDNHNMYLDISIGTKLLYQPHINNFKNKARKTLVIEKTTQPVK